MILRESEWKRCVSLLMRDMWRIDQLQMSTGHQKSVTLYPRSSQTQMIFFSIRNWVLHPTIRTRLLWMNQTGLWLCGISIFLSDPSLFSTHKCVWSAICPLRWIYGYLVKRSFPFPFQPHIWWYLFWSNIVVGYTSETFTVRYRPPDTHILYMLCTWPYHE